MKKIAVLNDLSGLGKCSLTAAIPVISVMGVQACPFPTAILSNQTGYASCFRDDYTDRMDAYMAEWKKRNLVFDGIYTGFLAGESQAEKILAFIEAFAREDTRILTDTVLGDEGKAYDFYTESFCEKIRGIAARAHVITPNLTEALLLLYGREGMESRWEQLARRKVKEYQKEIAGLGEQLAERFSLRAAVITGIDLPLERAERWEETGDTRSRSFPVGWMGNSEGNGNRIRENRCERSENQLGKMGAKGIGNLVWEKGRESWVISEKTGGSYSGTGDLFASIISAGMVKGLSVESCARRAAAFLEKGIRDAVAEGTDRNDGICFETYLHELACMV